MEDAIGRQVRSQSAMEYLMTYGWAILIIAVVLAALFSLNLFSGGGASGCISQPGFSCQGVVFNSVIDPTYNEPSFIVNFSSSISGWTQVYFTVVPAGQSLTTSTATGVDYLTDKGNFLYWAKTCGQYYGPVTSVVAFQTVTAKVYGTTGACPASAGGIGTHTTGALWAMYSTAQVTNALVQVATFGVTASR